MKTKEPTIFPTTSQAICDLLRKRYCGPEWAIFFEVASATGAGSARYADAIAMNLWPSRGLSIHGFEIKVSRSDWFTELKKPAKAEAMARNCDHWWIVAAKGVVREGELPPTWGLIEVDGRGLAIKVQAPKLDAPTLSRGFMAALIRRAGEFDAWQLRMRIEQETRAVAKSAEDRITTEIESRSRRFSELSAAVSEFEAASGLTITGWNGGKKIGQAVAVVQQLGVGAVYNGAASVIRVARQLADNLERAMPEMLVQDDDREAA